MNPAILHLEDNPDIIEVVALAFHTLGFDVELLRAERVDEAIRLIRQRREHGQRLDLVIVDMNLPGSSGLDFIRRVRSNPAWAAIPLIVLSCQTSKATVAEAYALGANCYFPKLLNDKTVFDVIDQLYTCWFKIGRAPDTTEPELGSEVLGRAISVKAQVSKMFMRLARQFSDFEHESGILLELAVNESNHANLLAFFSLDKDSIPKAALEKLSSYLERKEANLSAVQQSMNLKQEPTLADAAKWALRLDDSFDPDAFAMAAGLLFPNGPAATIALYESTLNHLELVMELAKTQMSDVEVKQKVESLKERMERARQSATIFQS